MYRRFVRLAWPVLLLIVFCPGCRMPAPLRVMSFNIRYGTASDGENRWENRREFVFETIRDYDPDVIGLQEVLAFQAEELRAALPDYEFVGVGRDDGARAGEFAPIMYRKKTLKLIRAGHFWLSDEPGRPGSVGWDATLPRLATWIVVGFKQSPLNQVCLANAHFDHRGAQARLESAGLLRRMLESKAGQPFVVLGDFNCGPGSPPYRELTADRGNLAELHDPFVTLGSELADVGTYHGFQGGDGGDRIDLILHNRRWEPIEVGIVREPHDGRYPSDHYPVTATLQLLPATRWGSL